MKERAGSGREERSGRRAGRGEKRGRGWRGEGVCVCVCGFRKDWGSRAGSRAGHRAAGEAGRAVVDRDRRPQGLLQVPLLRGPARARVRLRPERSNPGGQTEVVKNRWSNTGGQIQVVKHS